VSSLNGPGRYDINIYIKSMLFSCKAVLSSVLSTLVKLSMLVNAARVLPAVNRLLSCLFGRLWPTEQEH